MARKLFVGSLSWDTNSDSLRAAFEQYGEIEEAVVVSDRDTGRSRGFGFVRYTSDEAAAEALAAMNGSELDGRRLRVDFAEERGGGGGGRSGGYGGGGGRSGGYGGGGGGGGGRSGGYGGGGRRGGYDDDEPSGDPRERGTKRW